MGSLQSQAVLLAIGINWEGQRQILGVELANRGSQTSWRELLLLPSVDTHDPCRRAAADAGAQVCLSDVCQLVGPSRSSIYSRVGEGSFPAPVERSDHCVRRTGSDWL